MLVQLVLFGIIGCIISLLCAITAKNILSQFWIYTNIGLMFVLAEINSTGVHILSMDHREILSAVIIGFITPKVMVISMVMFCYVALQNNSNTQQKEPTGKAVQPRHREQM